MTVRHSNPEFCRPGKPGYQKTPEMLAADRAEARGDDSGKAKAGAKKKTKKKAKSASAK